MDIRQALADASVLLEQHNGAGARALALQVVAIEPDNALAWNQLATAYNQCGQFKDALAAAREAVKLYPKYADAQRNLAMLLLTTGEYSAGWEHYAWRHKCLDFIEHKRPYEMPEWDGSKCPSVLVVGEQGVGDQILYSSMIPNLASRVGTVVLECDYRLVPVFGGSLPAVVVPATIPVNERAASCTAQIAAGDLGRFIRPTKDSFPDRRGFLHPHKFGSLSLTPRIGYSGSSTNATVGKLKSMPLELWEPIFATQAYFVDLDTPRARMDLRHLMEEVSSCDAVVTVSNTVAHMAGALGISTLVMLGPPAGQYWYWGTGTRTPWYPTVQIVRQAKAGDWSVPIAAAVNFVTERHVGFKNTRNRR